MIDPIKLQVMWNRLVSIAEEAETTLVRTSFSTVISEARDFACILLDTQGRSIAQAWTTVPEFTLTLPTTVAYCLAKFKPEDLEPGDVLITNNPWQGSGHLSDINLVRPIYHNDRIVAYFGTSGHVSDIGGVIGYHSARDLFEEGLDIPITKLYRAGKPDSLLFSLIEANVRVPDLVLGDIAAMSSALGVGSDRVVEFLKDAGLDDLEELAREIGDRASRAMREALARLPEGEFEGAYTFDGYATPVTLKARVTIKDGTAHVDYTGTSPQVDKGAINAPLVISRADTLYFFQYLFTPDVPTCSALFDPIALTVPPGSILNPSPPVAVKARSKTTFHIPEALFNALAPIIPDYVQAASAHSCYVIANGRDAHGRAFNTFYLPGGGMGAAATRDGLDCTLFPTNTTVTPIEILENTAPLVVREKALQIDSGGPGKHRGGAGQTITLQSISSRPLTITLRPEDKKFPPKGLLGGSPGAPCRIWVNGELIDTDLLDLQPNDVLTIQLPGGGGFGSPFERPIELVERDVRGNLVSPQAARDEYGVVLEADTGRVNTAETQRLRASIKRCHVADRR